MASSLTKRLRDLDDKPRSSAPPMPGYPDSDDDRPMDGFVFAAMVMITFIALVAAGVFYGTRSIDNGIAGRISNGFRAAGLLDLEVEVEAREVLVIGNVSSEEQLADAIAYVESVEGVLSIETNMRVVVPRDPIDVKIASDPMIVDWNTTTVMVSGTASTQDVVDAVVLNLEDVFGTIDASGLTVREGVAGERDWLSTFLQLTARMRELTPVGTVFVSPDDQLIQVTAEFETRSERSGARQEAQDIVSATTFDFTSALTYEDAPPPPKIEQVVELQENIDELIEGKVVEFETDSDVITPVGEALLAEILVALQKFPDVSIEISGHTDDLGSDDYNLDLSRRRATAVYDYLVANGESPDRFVIVGYGETRPLVENTTDEGRARNRRIEFKALLDS